MKVDKEMKQYDVIIVGAGASGLICAGELGLRGVKTLVLNSGDKIGKKIKIAGGGRCNFTNLNVSKDNYVSNNPNFVISALKQFSNYDFIEMVKEAKIPYYEKKDGQLFCKNSSLDIINMLSKRCEQGSVKIINNYIVDDVVKQDDAYIVNSDYKTENLVIAAGGMSYKNLGASDIGYKIARKFGLKIIEPKPALVPLVIDGCDKLKGISLNVKVKFGKQSFTDDMLFTHFGLSGPAILKISNYWNKGEVIEIDLVPEIDIYDFLIKERESGNKKKLVNLLNGILPERLAEFIAKEMKINGNILELSNKKIREIANRINNWQVTPSKTKGFDMAEVTKGGVDVNEISSKTFESKKHNGLYFIGEVLDVTGELGGFNLQWASSSGASMARNLRLFP